MNPFTDKSLSQLRDMAPSLSDAELDALCAACEGEWALYISEFYEYHVMRQDYWIDPNTYTTDGREAIRLQVKYQLHVHPYWPFDGKWGAMTSPAATDFIETDNPCRAITLAAVTVVLTRMIEGDK